MNFIIFIDSKMDINAMKFKLYVLFFLCLSTRLSAQEAKDYKLIAVTESPKIDGELNDDVWQKCAVANGFTQTIPQPGEPSKYVSEVRMCYSNSAIYIAATLFQPKSLTCTQLTARDMLYNVNADIFSVYFDTYNDHQNGFVFKVSSAGVQHDERLSGGDEFGDQNWDAVWTSKVSLHEDKWQIEMEIPFSAIRFAKQDEMKWGINFFRSVRKLNENSYWNKIDTRKQGFLAQTGTLSGLKHITPPVRLFLFPYLTTGFLRQEEAGVNTQHWLRSGGVDVKYGLNESFTLDVTLIPDFSQVISDNLVRNLSPFEQHLDENRPFFTEGTELFNKAAIFYSRRVGGTPSNYYDVKYHYEDTALYKIEKNPNVTTLYNALKISGRNKRNVGIGFFNAVGAPMHATIKNKISGETIKEETEPLSNYNVFVYDKAFKGQSSFNFTNTNVWRNGIARDADVGAFILTKFNKKESGMIKLISKWSVLNTTQYEIGSALGIVLAKTSGKLTFEASADRLSPKFDKSDMGIQFEYNNSNQNLNISYNEDKPKAKHLQLYRINFNHAWAENAVPLIFKYYQVSASYFLLFKNFWDVTFSSESKPFAPNDFYQLGGFGKRLKTYPYWFISIDGSSDSRKKLFWAYNTGYGIALVSEKHTDYTFFNHSIRYRFSSHIDATVRGEMTRDNNNIGYAYYDNAMHEPVVGSRDLREYTGEFSLKYNINPNTNFTARFRHYNSFIRYNAFHTVDQYGEWRNNPVSYQLGHDENYNLQNIDVFFNWMFRPGSRVVLSYKQWLNDAYLLNDKAENSYFTNLHQIVKAPHAYELSLRIIYFLDYNQLKI